MKTPLSKNLGTSASGPPKGTDAANSRPRAIVEMMNGAVLRGLSPLGESGTQAVVYFMDKREGVSLQDAFERPDRFASALTNLFGSGGKVLERTIIDDVARTFALTERPDSLALTMEAVRQKLESR